MNYQFQKKTKYNSKRVNVDGMTFDSKLEAKYYGTLKLLKKSGELIFFLRQVPFDLPGNVKYRVDFVEFWKDGTIKFVDVKGYKTKDFIMKKKMVEDLYPITIEVVK